MDAADPGTTAPTRLDVGKPAPRENELLGLFCKLFARSPLHRRYWVADLERLIIPPIRLRQYNLLRMDGKIVGAVTWAFLSETAERDYMTNARLLQPADWRSGDRLWVIDGLLTVRGGRRAIKMVAGRLRADRISYIRRTPDGAIRKIVEVSRTNTNHLRARVRPAGPAAVGAAGVRP